MTPATSITPAFTESAAPLSSRPAPRATVTSPLVDSTRVVEAAVASPYEMPAGSFLPCAAWLPTVPSIKMSFRATRVTRASAFVVDNAAVLRMKRSVWPGAASVPADREMALPASRSPLTSSTPAAASTTVSAALRLPFTVRSRAEVFTVMSLPMPPAVRLPSTTPVVPASKMIEPLIVSSRLVSVSSTDEPSVLPPVVGLKPLSRMSW